jgi:hypothetical protein
MSFLQLAVQFGLGRENAQSCAIFERRVTEHGTRLCHSTDLDTITVCNDVQYLFNQIFLLLKLSNVPALPITPFVLHHKHGAAVVEIESKSKYIRN